jgi:hypothetical protein
VLPVVEPSTAASCGPWRSRAWHPGAQDVPTIVEQLPNARRRGLARIW